jgi:hypothetical protein
MSQREKNYFNEKDKTTEASIRPGKEERNKNQRFLIVLKG